MTESEKRFAELIWANEPIGSGELVKLCEQNFGWKKSTTYTVLKKLCEKQLFQNESATVTAVLKKDQYEQKKSEQFIEENYSGSLPRFLTAFMTHKKLSKKQVKELKDIINSYEEESYWNNFF